MSPQTSAPPTVPDLANRVASDLDQQAALDLVRRLEPLSINDLIDRSGLSGRLDKRVFDVLADAFDAVRCESEIRSLAGR